MIHRARVAALTRSRPPDDPELIAQRRLLYLSQIIHCSQQAAQKAPLTTSEASMVARLIQDGARDDVA